MPPPEPKKKRGGKKKKVVDPVALERQKIAEMEQRRRHEVILRSRLEDLMREEEEMSRVAATEIDARWMKFLRETKQKELVAQIEIIRNTFERSLDLKNSVLSMLADDLEETEEQHRVALQTHMENVDKLIDLQNRRLTDLEEQFEGDLLEMKADYHLEHAEQVRKHALELADLRLIIRNMTSEAELKEKKQQEETSETYETSIEKLDEEKRRMQGDLARANELIRAELDARYKEFMANAQANMKDYMDKTKEDNDTAERIASQMRKIQKLQENIATWKSNLQNKVRECEARNNALKAERDNISGHLNTLKRKMQQWRKNEERRLAELVSNARNAQLGLEKDAQAAERLLRLVELCRPYETERERVLAFDTDVTTEEVQQEVSQTVKRWNDESGESKMIAMKSLFSGTAMDSTATEEWRMLERFWVRYNKVVLDNAAISQERYHLQQENAKLKSLLKQYLDGISVNPNVMSQANNLLRTERVPNVVEANEERTIQLLGTVNKSNQVTEGNKVMAEIAKQRNF